jgi:hypothetical protein
MILKTFLKTFAPSEGKISFQSLQYSYKVGEYCTNSSSPERVGIYFSGLKTGPCGIVFTSGDWSYGSLREFFKIQIFCFFLNLASLQVLTYKQV